MSVQEYKDKHGKKIQEGMSIKHIDGDVEKVYKSDDGELGLNASNENFIGFNPIHRELYPLYQFDLREWEIVEK